MDYLKTSELLSVSMILIGQFKRLDTSSWILSLIMVDLLGSEL